MKIQNNQNGEILSVSNVFQSEGQIIYRINGRNWQRPGTRFFNSFPMLSDTGGTTGDGWAILELSEPWQIVSGSRSVSPSSPAEPSPVQAAEPAGVATGFNVGDRVILTDGHQLSNGADYATIIYVDERNGKRQYLIDNLSGLWSENQLSAYIEPEPEPVIVSAGVDPEEVAKIVDEKTAYLSAKIEELEEKIQKGGKVTIEVKTPLATNKVNGATIAEFGNICKLVSCGYPVYMSGPAGCGKSFTARQIADGLGLDYYESSTVLFAHDLKGYGDAGGKFVETPFYKAVKFGGLFFLDEVDASAPEALVVLNNLIANGSFDFPVVGLTKAHENFRVIAAGNTQLTGATLEYCARQMQDSSFKNRFFFVGVDYDPNLENTLSGGDSEIVEFVHDLRQSAKVAQMQLTVSYRQIKMLADPNLADMELSFLIKGGILQEKENDDIRILAANMVHKENRYFKALEKLY